ncbi:putative P450 monooxygenase [Lepidopterella palustris CBS 459.81]|uniref:Putative P450 monooxygenase n=1 Tax=Lepidopterella palustris CBS 459.81 TaxID=1314670 RepID=A0A8E2E071_9PEZI|nr:putative P450 monooxygenase [Lepidopterella palustris CBS 459.81]
MEFTNLAKVAAIGLVCILTFRQLYTALLLVRKRQVICREKGVLPAPWYPFWDRLFGIDLLIKNTKVRKEHRVLEQQFTRFREMNANTFRLVLLGRHIHYTIEAENLKHILALEFKKWSVGSRRILGLAPLLGQGIFTSDGTDWQHSRQMLRPNFTRTQVADLGIFERHVADLISAVPHDGSMVDLSELFFRLTMDTATEHLFGESTESLTKSTGEGFAEAFCRSQDHVVKASRWRGVGLEKLIKLLPPDGQFERDRKFVHNFVDSYVDKALAKSRQLKESDSENSDRYIFIDELVRQTTDRVRIRSEALNVLLAGRDTTASLLTNLWFTLSNRPDIWAKLQAEIAHFQLHGGAPSFEELKEMKYLRALLNESLRLYPVVPANGREAVEDTVLPMGGGPGGNAPIFVRKGEVVMWSVYAMHRRKDYYGEDAEDFNPERWLDDSQKGRKGIRPGWEYLPFNGGARICLGQQFALTEASYTTVRLCQAFDKIESRDTRPWTEMLTLMCVNLGGAKVALTRRSEE